jgi:hypothetical protein
MILYSDTPFSSPFFIYLHHNKSSKTARGNHISFGRLHGFILFHPLHVSLVLHGQKKTIINTNDNNIPSSEENPDVPA